MDAKTFAAILNLVFLAGYWILVWALLWHYRQYSLPKDKARWVIGFFLFFAVALTILSIITLFLVDWSEILNLMRGQAR